MVINTKVKHIWLLKLHKIFSDSIILGSSLKLLQIPTFFLLENKKIKILINLG